ncbi:MULTISPECIES: hypothetical protein [unclassified Nocardia]|uniref:hypothetical protein n=1 Tax=unclassified Nocardia TaxID=2637762 RepID=UPI00278C5863|nr:MULTISPECIES: hypothetical protein [unclassified Nocardia]
MTATAVQHDQLMIRHACVCCDQCAREEHAEIAARSSADADTGLRQLLVREHGWICDIRGDYCPACTVTTVDALAELPSATVIRDRSARVLELDHAMSDRPWFATGSSYTRRHDEIVLPAVIIWRPKPHPVTPCPAA